MNDKRITVNQRSIRLTHHQKPKQTIVHQRLEKIITIMQHYVQSTGNIVNYIIAAENNDYLATEGNILLEVEH